MAGFLVGCGGASHSAPSTDRCGPTPTACTQPAPAYAADIAPLLDRACNTPSCHGGGGAAWPLTPYVDVAAWSDPILVDVEGCTMPPADAGALSAEERAEIIDWIACGASND